MENGHRGETGASVTKRVEEDTKSANETAPIPPHLMVAIVALGRMGKDGAVIPILVKIMYLFKFDPT